MDNRFFVKPILNSRYERPRRHWELDQSGQPTQQILETRREDAKEKKSTMDTYWVPGVNHLGTHGRWAFAEFTDVWGMQEDFETEVKKQFSQIVEEATDLDALPGGEH